MPFPGSLDVFRERELEEWCWGRKPCCCLVDGGVAKGWRPETWLGLGKSVQRQNNFIGE